MTSLPDAHSTPDAEPGGPSPPGCAHCGLPVPPHRCAAVRSAPLLANDAGSSRARSLESSPEASACLYCCAGCEAVAALLQDCGLQSYYELRAAVGAPSVAAKTTSDQYLEYDAPEFLEAHAEQSSGQYHLDLLLEGVHCAACVWLVEQLPRLVEGLTRCRLDLSQRICHLSWPTGVPLRVSQIARTLDRLGYVPHPSTRDERAARYRRENRAILGRLAVAAASAGNVMLLSWALYSGAVSGMSPQVVNYLRAASLVASLPSIVWSAQVFYRGALSAVRLRRPHMDLPITLGIGVGSSWGAYNTLWGGGETYFDSVTALIFLLLVGRSLQLRQQHKAERYAGDAAWLAPRSARIVTPEGCRTLPASSVKPGDQLEVLAGETFAADGQVVEGHSHADTRWLSGEPRPAAIAPGSQIYAGCVNRTDRVLVSVQRSGEQTRVARLRREVARAAQRRAPIARLADRMSGYFFAGAVSLAALAMVLWWPSGPAAAFDAATALLIVTCPCALGLATPLAVSAALGQAARRGWLIKDGAALEALSGPSTFVFDKTGTLTEGQLRLLEWSGDKQVKPVVKALEARSAHPIARALATGLGSVVPATVDHVEEELGMGVRGLHDGAIVFVGRVPEPAGPLAPWARSALRRYDERGLSTVAVVVEGELRALAGLGDTPLPGASEALRQLHRAGHRLHLLSGDRQAVVDRLAEQLSGSEPLFERALGDASPEEKLAHVEAARHEGTVVMVGDGVNDAAALSAATVGVAVHGGAEASLDAADAIATRAGVLPLLDLVQGARRTLAVVRLNLILSLGYNAVTASLALAGLITPLVAAVLMPISSLSVVTHSYRSRFFKGAAEQQEPFQPPNESRRRALA